MGHVSAARLAGAIAVGATDGAAAPAQQPPAKTKETEAARPPAKAPKPAAPKAPAVCRDPEGLIATIEDPEAFPLERSQAIEELLPCLAWKSDKAELLRKALKAIDGAFEKAPGKLAKVPPAAGLLALGVADAARRDEAVAALKDALTSDCKICRGAAGDALSWKIQAGEHKGRTIGAAYGLTPSAE